MPIRLILGKASPGAGSGGTVSPRIYGTRMDAQYTAKLTEFRMFAGATANFRGCVYNTDLDLLWQGASTACTISTWAAQAINPAVSVTNAVEFALAAKGDATNTQKFEVDAAYYSWIHLSGTFGDDFPDPGDDSFAQAGRTYLYQAWGWILPTITAVNAGSSIATTDTNIPITGADFMPTQGTGVITMANNADWDLATVKTPQVLGSSGWGDSTVYFDATGLSAGTWYAFVTTDLDQRNAVGEAVTVTGGAAVPTGVCVVSNPAQSGSASGATVPTGTATVSNASQSGAVTGDTIPVGALEASNSSQGVSDADGATIPTGSLSVDNPAQSGSASGKTIPVGVADVSNPPVSGSSSGVTVPVGTSDVSNAPQSGDATGETVSGVPTGTCIVSNPVVSGEAVGTSVPVGVTEVDNLPQSGSASGIVVPVGVAEVGNPPQSGGATGETVTTVPTGTCTVSNPAVSGSASGLTLPTGTADVSNSPQSGSASGKSIPVGILNAFNRPQFGTGVGVYAVDLTPGYGDPIKLYRDNKTIALYRDVRIIKLVRS